MPPSDPPDVDPRLSEAVHRTYVRPVDELVAARHVTALAAAAREADLSPQPVSAPRRRRRAVKPALVTALAAAVLPAGLAVAGVQLPDPVRAPYDVVGVDLPNQDERADRPATPATARPAGRPRTARPVASAGRQARMRRRGRPEDALTGMGWTSSRAACAIAATCRAAVCSSTRRT